MSFKKTPPLSFYFSVDDAASFSCPPLGPDEWVPIWAVRLSPAGRESFLGNVTSLSALRAGARPGRKESHAKLGADYSSPAPTLTASARIVVLNRKASTVWASARRRMRFETITTSEVCAAAPRLNEKYRKSQ